MNPGELVLITPPTGLPLTLEEAKGQCRIELEQTEDDDALTAMIGAAVDMVQGPECWIQLCTATYELRLDRFPCGREIFIPRPPLRSVQSVKYIDADGNLQTFGTSDGLSPEGIREYSVDVKSIHEPAFGEVRLNHGYSWPQTRCERNAVRVLFTCGFGDPAAESPYAIMSSLPASIRQWMLLQVGAMNENRESFIVGVGHQAVNLGPFVDRLLDRWRVRTVA